jgi:hypothetical protein
MFHWARKRLFHIVQLYFDKQIQEVITIYMNLFSIDYYCYMDVERAKTLQRLAEANKV